MRTNPRADRFEEDSGLFQRVQAPLGLGYHNPFCFGGGGSGLSEAAENGIASVLSWDYMGRAEFEFGAAGRCLSFMFTERKHMYSVNMEAAGAVWHLLVHKGHKAKAQELWRRVLAGTQPLKEAAKVGDPEIEGWFDFTNGWFVSRSAQMRDELAKLLGAGGRAKKEPAT